VLADALDPVAAARVLRRYFEAESAVLARYGATVEQSTGEAVTGVFGVPISHEDDALRAARRRTRAPRGAGDPERTASAADRIFRDSASSSSERTTSAISRAERAISRRRSWSSAHSQSRRMDAGCGAARST